MSPDLFRKNISIGFLEKIQESINNLNPKGRIIFWLFSLLLVISSLGLFITLSRSVSVEVPKKGGQISEGVIGSPRFVNPLLAISDTDRDLTNLVYSGLMKATPEGDLINDLADSYEISSDAIRYVFIIKENATFHDGEPVEADDIVFTINMAKNDALKSPRRASWDGINVEKINERTVAFNLNEPYSPFLENTTIGILPEHLWGDLKVEEMTFSDLNSAPVGSGPYEIESIKKNSSGIPESYTLKSFDDYTLGQPYINKIEMKFYANEEELIKAFSKKDVLGIHAIQPEKARELREDGKNIISSPLPRVFGLFFNQSQATVFTNKEVRVALDESLNKERIINEVLSDFGTIIDGPLPAGVSIKKSPLETTLAKSEIDRTQEGIDILERNGWERGEDGVMIKETKEEDFRLSFSISTSNVPELKAVANILKEEWEKIGAEVELKFFESGSLNQEVIRPRDYDSLLFGEIVGRDFDLFAFWHSSQRNDPGLNIALYANIDSDALLEKIRSVSTKKEKEEAYIKFREEIDNDVPAVFLYSPDFIYATNKEIKGLDIGIITTPAERFLNVHEWHLKTDSVWPFFAN